MRTVIFALFFLLGISCGSDSTVETPAPKPGPGPGPGPEPKPGDKISYQQMQNYLVQYCQRCHASAGFMGSEGALRNSRVLQELQGKSMPPNSRDLPDNIRTLMINFF